MSPMHALYWLYLDAAYRDPADPTLTWRQEHGGDARCWLCGVACPAGEPRH